jgi:hypothetical protein
LLLRELRGLTHLLSGVSSIAIQPFAIDPFNPERPTPEYASDFPYLARFASFFAISREPKTTVLIIPLLPSLSPHRILSSVDGGTLERARAINTELERLQRQTLLRDSVIRKLHRECLTLDQQNAQLREAAGAPAAPVRLVAPSSPVCCAGADAGVDFRAAASRPRRLRTGRQRWRTG